MVAARTTPLDTRTVDPARDRMPYGRKLRLLADAGHWPALDRLYRQYGAASPEVGAFIDDHLPKAYCGHCGEPYYDHSRRVKYCSDRCRRLASYGRSPLPPVSVALPAPVQLALPERTSPVRRFRRGRTTMNQGRLYEIQVIPRLLGGAALIRRWGARGRAVQQWIDQFEDVDTAERARERYCADVLKRGYVEEE